MTQFVNNQTSFNWKIAGKAGDGVMLAGKLLAKAAKRHGLQAFNYLEYPSLIKGGHQTAQVYVSAENASCHKRLLDVLIAVNEDGIKEHLNEINDKTIIVFNNNSGKLEQFTDLKAKIYSIPFYDLLKNNNLNKITANILSLGISSYLLGLDKEFFIDVLKQEFAGKSKIIESNTKAFEIGFEEIAKSAQAGKTIDKKEDKTLLINGNEAVGLGALAAGVQYYAAYPMTPATGLLHYLAEIQEHYSSLVVKHTEDEIGAIVQALGASYAGVRSMTGTSGGGFALMVEALSMAGVTEVPIVIHEAQRTGPATGVPTWTAQADLQFVVRAGHGDFERVVLTPGDVEEHFNLAIKAFQLAEKYQIPVFILSDKYILESHQTMPIPEGVYKNPHLNMVTTEELPEDNSYRRYKLTEEGISKRSIPGQAHGLQITNSYEHDEFGFATEDAAMIKAQVKKRMKKLDNLVNEIPQPYLVGSEQAEVTFVAWGSTINVLKEVVLKSKKTVNVIHLPAVWPFPRDSFMKLATAAKRLVMVEGNATGQCQQLIRQETGLEINDYLRRYDSQPFYVDEILEWLNSIN